MMDVICGSPLQGSVVVQGGSDEGDAEARMRRDKIKEVRQKDLSN